MRTLIVEYGAGDFERTASGFDVVDEYGQRCNGLCMGEMLEQVVGLVVQGRARYPMLTPEQWIARRQEMEERGAARREAWQSRTQRLESAAARLHAVCVQMDAEIENDRPSEDEYQAAMAALQDVLDTPF